MEEEQAQKDFGEEVGKVTHFFANINVAVIKLTEGELEDGDTIRIKGATTDFEQDVKSMQIDHEDIEKAEKGQEFGMKVKDRVRKHDKVYKT
ncbi:hypothetical protein GF327_10240 [Candidatus Woesearchaeota archaeon]|nr:hypothetical protein [Candidatus Woesearchaeota archaeon]